MQGKITEDMPDVTSQKKVWMTNGKVVIEVPTVDITAFQSKGFQVVAGKPKKETSAPKSEPKAKPEVGPRSRPKMSAKPTVKEDK